MSVILLDVDYFKNYNDTYGHPAGDEVLQRLADVLRRASTRAGEVAARFGGEEFILLLPGASADSAMRTAQRLRKMIALECITHGASLVGEFITVSQGVITVRPDGEEQPSDLLKRVDLALYEAKKAGRDQIIVASMQEQGD